MNKKILIIIGLIMFSSIVFSFGITEKLRIVKDEPYVPAPINPSLHEKYIQENYVQIINDDETVSFVRVIN